MEDKTLFFQEHYKKLDQIEFTTIRRGNKKLKKNDIVVVKTPKTSFKAKVTWCRQIPLVFIKDDFLCEDTGTKTRKEALKVLRKFYPYLKEDTWVLFIFLRDEEAYKLWKEKKHVKEEYKKNV